MNIKLYIGAHKTATTHIQSMLENSKNILIENGIKLLTPKNLRPNFLDSLIKVVNSSVLEDIKTLIIAEENIIGVPYDFKIYHGIYPKIQNRLNNIKNIFPNADIEIFFSIRAYDSFYRSIYLEVVRNRGYMPFNKFYNKKKFKDNSWVFVLESISAIVPKENITLWCYEDLHELFPLIIDNLTGLKKSDEIISKYKVQRTRASLSSKTIKVLDSFYSSGNQEEGSKIIEYLNNKYPLNKINLPYLPFNELEVTGLKDKYIEDIKLIQNLYPNINLLNINGYNLNAL